MIDATAVSVVWNEGHRIAPLAATLAQNFDEVVIVVQESTDDTLDLARKTLAGHPKAKVIEDEHRGGGDFSMPLALSHVTNKWSFVISGDEFPDYELIQSLPQLLETLDNNGLNGAFIEFEETIDDVPYVEHKRHVRVFRTSTGWEARHHSAATHENVIVWPIGKIIHTRTLDEFAADYLRKLTMMEEEGGEVNERLAQHNRYTIFTVCGLVAAAKSWRRVWSLPMWEEIDRRVFSAAPTTMEVL